MYVSEPTDRRGGRQSRVAHLHILSKGPSAGRWEIDRKLHLEDEMPHECTMVVIFAIQWPHCGERDRGESKITIRKKECEKGRKKSGEERREGLDKTLPLDMPSIKSNEEPAKIPTGRATTLITRPVPPPTFGLVRGVF